MGSLLNALIGWVVHAAVNVAAVRVVSPGNPRNTLGRALAVTAVAAVVVTPFTWMAIFILPLLVAAVLWFLIYWLAYGLGPLQSIGVALLQAVIGWLVGLAVAAIYTAGV